MNSREEGKGQGLEMDETTVEVLAQEKGDDVRPTYKSFKYGFPSAHNVCLSFGGQLSDNLQHTTTLEKEQSPNHS
jgi:hypothetical protein